MTRRLRPREQPAGRSPAASRGALGASLAALLATACGASVRATRPDPIVATPAVLPFFIPIPEETRERIVAAAGGALHHGPGPFRQGGHRFNADCSGFVAFAYQAAGIPFREALHVGDEDAGSAVVALYRALASNGILFGREGVPLPGDLVFWHDTYDRNGDGIADDPLTHVGIVERAFADGTVNFFHRGARGVLRGVMSLRHPGEERGAPGERLNSRLRPVRRNDPPGTRYLAGELFTAFGRFDAARIAAALEGSPDLSLAALGLDE